MKNSQNSKLKKILINLFKFCLTAIIVYYLIASGRLDFSKLALLWDSPLLLFGSVATLLFVIIPLTALRWWMLLKAAGLEVSLWRSYILTWIGNFFNVSLPGAVSGDLVKGYYIIKSKQDEGKTRTLMTLMIDRFVGLFGLIVMAFITLVFNYDIILANPAMKTIAGSITALFSGTVFFYLIILFPFKEGKDPFIKLFGFLPLSHITLKVYKAFKAYQNHKKTLILTLIIAILVHSIVALIFFMISRLVVVADITLATQLFIMPIGLITTAIPVAPGGVGIGHAAFESLYHIIGVDGGANVFNLFIIIQISTYALGGIPYFSYKGEYQVPLEEEE